MTKRPVRKIVRKTKEEDYDDEDEEIDDDFDEKDDDDEDTEEYDDDDDDDESDSELVPSWMTKIENRQKKLWKKMQQLEKVEIQDKITNGINQALQEIGLNVLKKPNNPLRKIRQKGNVVDREKTNNRKPLVSRRKK